MKKKARFEANLSQLDKVIFDSIKFDSIDFYLFISDISRSVFIDCEYIKGHKQCNHRPLYRQLKLSAKLNDDSISFLYYRSKELDSYRKELSISKPSITNDKIILWLSVCKKTIKS